MFSFHLDYIVYEDEVGDERKVARVDVVKNPRQVDDKVRKFIELCTTDADNVGDSALKCVLDILEISDYYDDYDKYDDP